jgi:hypothetical protein
MSRRSCDGFRGPLSRVTRKAHTDAVPDDDDRPRDASSAADRSWDEGEDLAVAWSNAVAPDDISELVADVKAYHRELRAQRRRQALHRRFDRRGAVPLTMVLAGLALAAAVALLASLVVPNHGKPPGPAKLSATAADPRAGGLLPAAQLLRVGTTQQVASRALRPAVLALVPDPCHCTALLDRIAADARAEGLPLVVIAPNYPDAEVAALSGRLDGGRSTVLYDAANLLRTELRAAGLTVVALDRDGTDFRVTPGVTAATESSIRPELVQMLSPKASTG